MTKDKFKVKGHFTIEQIKDGKVIDKWEQDNTVVMTGHAWLLSMISGIDKTKYGGSEELAYIAVGNSDKSNDLSSDGVEEIDWRLTSEGTIAEGGTKCREPFDTTTSSPVIIEDTQVFHASAVFSDDSFPKLPYGIKEMGVFLSDTPPDKNPLSYDQYKPDAMFSRAVISSAIVKYNDGTDLRVSYKLTVSKTEDVGESGWYEVFYDGFNDCEEGRISPLVTNRTDSSGSDAIHDTNAVSWTNNSNELKIGIDGVSTTDGYLRFQINELLDGEHYLRFRVTPDNLDDDEDIDIILIDSDNCPAFPNGAGDAAAYPESAIYVTENFNDGTASYVKEINITTLYESFISRAGFVLGNYMGIKIKGSVLVGADNFIYVNSTYDIGKSTDHPNLTSVIDRSNIRKLDCFLAEEEEFNPLTPYYRTPIDSLPSFSISTGDADSIGNYLTIEPSPVYAGDDMTIGIYYNLPFHQGGYRTRFRFRFDPIAIADDTTIMIVANCFIAPFTALGIAFTSGFVIQSFTAPANHVEIGLYDIIGAEYEYLTTQLQPETWYWIELTDDFENGISTVAIYDDDGNLLETESFNVSSIMQAANPPTLLAFAELAEIGINEHIVDIDEIRVYRKPSLIP